MPFEDKHIFPSEYLSTHMHIVCKSICMALNYNLCRHNHEIPASEVYLDNLKHKRSDPYNPVLELYSLFTSID